MNELVYSLTADVGGLLTAWVDWFSRMAFELRVAAVVISAILLWSIIRFLAKAGYHHYQADALRDRLMIKNLTRVRAQRNWRKTLVRLRKQDSKEWRLALIEMERTLSDLIKSKPLPKEIEDLEEARNLAGEAKGVPDMVLSQEAVVKALRAYKKAFLALGIL